ncbi:MAG: hypothetical protein AAGD07_25820 [Planctomycetota bacterium]
MKRRIGRPWKRGQNGYWYVTIDGKQVALSKDESEALKLWAEQQLQRDRQSAKDPLVDEVVGWFLIDVLRQTKSGRISKKTLADYKWYCDFFATEYGQQHVSEIEPLHVTGEEKVSGTALGI